MRITIWLIRVLFLSLAVLVAVYIGRSAAKTKVGRSSVRGAESPADAGQQVLEEPETYDGIAVALGLGIAAAIIILDVIYKKKSIAVIVAVSLGLIAGTLLELLVRRVVMLAGFERWVVPSVELAILLFFCYIAITIILQTREDFRFVIPYMKFQPQGSESPPSCSTRASSSTDASPTSPTRACWTIRWWSRDTSSTRCRASPTAPTA